MNKLSSKRVKSYNLSNCEDRFSGKTPSVLLAEDDTQMRAFLKESFSKNGYEVVECIDGSELLKCLACISEGLISPDVIVSDIKMPGMGGLNILAAHYYSGENFPPMILITAFGNKDTHEKARSLGAVAVLDKPFLFEELLKCVEQNINK